MLIKVTRNYQGDNTVIVDVYDTYATAPNGAVLHFEAVVPTGTTLEEVGRLVHEYVGGVDPEIEMEWTAQRACRAPRAIRELQQAGLHTVSLKPIRAAG
ncbi:MAG: DUF2024 family protein [Planctomycetaceae bacterium]|nr:DUF2024 family protein [Planctomycetaceae bacterium]MCB9953628.1 DUF2024 family protein [Planctomycetaceae bacterium]